MHPISSAHKENILSLASHGHSTCYIASQTGISQPTVSRALHELLPNQKPLTLVILPSSLQLLHAPFSPRLLLARVPMLTRLPETLGPLSPTQSPPCPSEM